MTRYLLILTSLLCTTTAAMAQPLQNLPGKTPFLPKTANTTTASSTKKLPIALNPADQTALSLTNAVVLALHKNPTLQMAFNNRKVQRYDLLVAQQHFMPQVTIGSSLQYNKYTNTGNTGSDSSSITRSADIGPHVSWTLPLGTILSGNFDYSPGNNTSENSSSNSHTSWTISIKQPLLQGFGWDTNLVSLRNAKDQQKIDSLQLEQSVITTVIQTATDYYAVLQAKLSYHVAKHTLAEKQHTLFVRKQRYKAGRIPGMDINQAELDITTQQQALAKASESLNSARSKLITDDLGLPGDTRFHVTNIQTLKPITLRPLKKAITFAKKHSLDMKIAKLQFEQSQRKLLSSEDKRRWTLDLTASRSHTIQRNNLDNNTSTTVPTSTNTLTDSSSVGLNLSIPLDRVSIDQSTLTSAIAMQNAQITMRKAVRSLVTNVTTSQLNLRDLWAQYQVSKQQLTFTQKNVEAAQIKFQYGKLDAFSLSQQEEQLVQTQNSLINAKIAYLTAVLNYEKLIGTLLKSWHITFKGKQHV